MAEGAHSLPRLIVVCATGVLVIALAVMVAWIFDVPWLRSFTNTTIEMKVITALTFIAAAIALATHHSAPRLSDSFSVLVALLGTASLAQYLFAINLGIDSALIREASGAVETTHPGRMAPNTALAFLIFGVAKLSLRSRSRQASVVGRTAVFVLLVIPLVVLIGYAYAARGLRGMDWASPMALSTAIGLALLAVGTAALYREQWPFTLLQGDTGSAQLARTVVPGAFVLTLAFGWIRLYAERSDVVESAFGVAMFALFTVIVLTGVIVVIVSRLRRAETADLQRSSLLRRTISTLDLLGESPLESERLAEVIITQAQELSGGDGAMLVVPDRGGACYRDVSGSATPLRDRVLPVGGVIAEAMRSEDLIALCSITDNEIDPILKELVDARSVAAVPLRYGGVLLGALAVVSRTPGAFGSAECDALRLIATAAAARMAQAGQYEAKSAYVREQSAALTTLRHEFSAFMENIPAAAFIKDRQGHYIYANPFVELMLRVEMANVLGARDADILPAPVTATLRAGEETMLENDTVAPITIRIFEDDEAPYWLLLRFPIRDQHDRVFIGGVGVDVSEVKRAEQRVAELNATLEARVAARTAAVQRANDELEAFSYSVSHDLRAPLRAVSGYARILEEEFGPSLDGEGPRYLATIRQEAVRMGQLIDDLLAFSRVARQHLSNAEIDMSNLVASVFDEVKRSRPDRQMELVAEELPAVHGDRATLRQVLVNLVSNAAKYAKPEGVIRIEAGGRREDDEIIYWIRDHGVGFDMRYSDKLFQVFQRLHTSEQFEGTGVGLAIVERIIARHGGRVWAEGEVGRGASFYFSLPLAAPAATGLSPARDLV